MLIEGLLWTRHCMRFWHIITNKMKSPPACSFWIMDKSWSEKCCGERVMQYFQIFCSRNPVRNVFYIMIQNKYTNPCTYIYTFQIKASQNKSLTKSDALWYFLLLLWNVGHDPLRSFCASSVGTNLQCENAGKWLEAQLWGQADGFQTSYCLGWGSTSTCPCFLYLQNEVIITVYLPHALFLDNYVRKEMMCVKDLK